MGATLLRGVPLLTALGLAQDKPSLVGRLMGWFSKKKKEEKPVEDDHWVLREIVKQFAGDAWDMEESRFGSPDDATYLKLPENKLKDFVFKYHTSQWKQAYKKETQDCDDFAYVAKADIIKGQQDAGLSSPLPFGFFAYERTDGARHVLNFAIDDKDKVWLYEPQTKKWSDKIPADLKRVTEVRF